MKRGLLILAVGVSLLAALTVQSATKPTGTLKVPAGLVLELKVAGRPVAVPTGRDLPLPAGTYEPATLTCGGTMPAARGRAEVWTLKATGPTWGKLKEIVIQEGETTAIDAGPPFTIKTLIYRTESTPTGKVVPITIRVFGKAGELYDLNTFKKGLSQAPQLALQIVDDKGTVLASGTLPYG
jgi:hypothetical protein